MSINLFAIHIEKEKNGIDNIETIDDDVEISEETISDVLNIGDRVTLANKKEGIIKFIGSTQFSGDTPMLGIELDEEDPTAQDGSVGNKQYFKTNMGHATFVFRADVVAVGNKQLEQSDNGMNGDTQQNEWSYTKVMQDSTDLSETQKLQLAERTNEIYRHQVKIMQDHLASLRSLIKEEDKENIIENLMLRYDLGLIPQDSNRQGCNLGPDEIGMEELRRKAEALAQTTILENFELREMINEVRDENFHLRNEIYELQDKINRQVVDMELKDEYELQEYELEIEEQQNLINELQDDIKERDEEIKNLKQGRDKARESEDDNDDEEEEQQQQQQQQQQQEEEEQVPQLIIDKTQQKTLSEFRQLQNENKFEEERLEYSRNDSNITKTQSYIGWKNKAETAKQEIDRLQRERKQSIEQVTRLTQTVEELKASKKIETNKYETQLQQLRQDITKFRKKYQESDKIRKDSISTLHDNLFAKLLEAEAEHEEMVADYKQQINKLQKTNKQFEISMNAMAKTKVDTIQSLANTIDKLRQSVTVLSKQVQILKNKNNQLQSRTTVQHITSSFSGWLG